MKTVLGNQLHPKQIKRQLSSELQPVEAPAYEGLRFLSGRITRGHTKDAAIVPPAREQLGIVK